MSLAKYVHYSNHYIKIKNIVSLHLHLGVWYDIHNEAKNIKLISALYHEHTVAILYSSFYKWHTLNIFFYSLSIIY